MGPPQCRADAVGVSLSLAALTAGEKRSRKASDFCLESSQYDTVCLHDYLQEGPVVLWFHRGHS